MTKETKRYIAAVLILIFGVLIYMFCSGDTLKLTLEVPLQATGGSVTTADGSVAKVEKCEIADGLMTVLFKSTGKGRTAAHVNWEPADNVELNIYNLDLDLSTTFTGGLKESVSGIYTGWGGTVAGLTVFLLLSTYTLLRSFKLRVKKELFSYLTVLCAGLGLFTLILSLFCLRFASECLVDPTMTLWILYMRIITACQSFLIWTAPIVVIFALALLVSNIFLLSREGFCLGNLWGILVSLLMIGGAAGGIALFYSTLIFPLRNVVSNIYGALYCYFICMLFSVTMCTLAAGYRKPDYGKEYIVILGCKIRPDGSLYPMIRGRVDRAVEFAAEQEKNTGENVFFIPSGGKGTDEILSESEAMARYLRQQGIDDQRIFVEKQSTTTWENMQCSKVIADRLGADSEKIVFSTTNFHVFRSGILAREAGWKIDGMGSKTVWYFWPNAFIREFMGLLYAKIWMHLAIILVLSAVFAAITLIA